MISVGKLQLQWLIQVPVR